MVCLSADAIQMTCIPRSPSRLWKSTKRNLAVKTVTVNKRSNWPLNISNITLQRNCICVWGFLEERTKPNIVSLLFWRRLLLSLQPFIRVSEREVGQAFSQSGVATTVAQYMIKNTNISVQYHITNYRASMQYFVYAVEIIGTHLRLWLDDWAYHMTLLYFSTVQYLRYTFLAISDRKINIFP